MPTRATDAAAAPAERSELEVAVIGTGYVGLTTGACLAHIGWNVTCVDVDQAKIALLNDGEIPIVEEGLDKLVREAQSADRIRFSTDTAAASATADIVFLCVPTPQDEDGSADLSFVTAVAAQIAPHLRPGAVVVNKSTVPVGSARIVAHELGRDDVEVVSNPEFLREGSAVADFLHPDRVVIGSDVAAAAERVASLYEPLGAPIMITDTASAEAIKYAANGFLALKLSFVNSVAAWCEAVGADVMSVIEGIGSDRRIGRDFLRPGPGWGGSCFPKDTRALIAVAAQHGYDFTMMRNVIAVNQEQRERMVRKIAGAVGRPIGGFRPLDGVRVAVLGLTYKAGTDDMRESPSLSVIDRLQDLGAEVVVYDPTTTGTLSEAQRLRLGSLTPRSTIDEAVTGADVTAILTEWPEFAHLDPNHLSQLMRGAAVVDTRNLLDPSSVEGAGLHYFGVGRGRPAN